MQIRGIRDASNPDSIELPDFASITTRNTQWDTITKKYFKMKTKHDI
jgi:hypothetical protein